MEPKEHLALTLKGSAIAHHVELPNDVWENVESLRGVEDGPFKLIFLFMVLRMSLTTCPQLAIVSKVDAETLRTLALTHVDKVDLGEWTPLLEMVTAAYEQRSTDALINVVQWPGWKVNTMWLPSYGYERHRDISIELQQASWLAWNVPFVGNAPNVLWNNIVYCTNYESRHRIYAYYNLFVQSSGMGKSRAVSKLSEKHFVVPMCLRKGTNGYPPQDLKVYSFLMSPPATFAEYAARVQAFLISMFIQLRTTLEEEAIGIYGEAELSDWFKKWLEKGSTNNSYGKNRETFFAKIVQRAELLCYRPRTAEDIKLVKALKNEHVPPEIIVTCNSQEFNPDDRNSGLLHLPAIATAFIGYLCKRFGLQRPYDHSGPLLVLSFDEAHHLFDGVIREVNRSRSLFSGLRSILRYMDGGQKIFTLFLSRTGQIVQPPEPIKIGHTSRVEAGILRTFEPFYLLGFDQQAEGLVHGDGFRIAEAVSDQWIVKFGRPLWNTLYHLGSGAVKRSIFQYAASKLTGSTHYTNADLDTQAMRLAVVAVRLGLSLSAKTRSDKELELELVEGHMRMLQRAWPDFEAMQTTTPSEPALVEGSILLMELPKFDHPRILADVLRNGLVNPSERGEDIAAFLLLLSRDRAWRKADSRGIPVLTFLNELSTRELSGFLPTAYKEGSKKDVSLESAFRGALVHFTHVLTVEGPNQVSRNRLWLLMARGALIACPHHSGVDFVIPVVFGDVVSATTISAIFIQVHNSPILEIETAFRGMDSLPGQFVSSESELKAFDYPLLRVVMAFKNHATEPVFQPSQNSKAFTSYDIICYGTESYKVVNDQGKDKWEDCLDLNTPFVSLFTPPGGRQMSPGLLQLVHRQRPGIATDEEYPAWVSPGSNLQKAEKKEDSEEGGEAMDPVEEQTNGTNYVYAR